MKDPISSLRRFAKRMREEYPEMNYGGCCVFASIVGEYMQQVFPTRVAVGGYGYEPPIDEVRPKIKSNTPREWNRKGVYFCHVAVEFDHGGKAWYFDTNGIKPAADQYVGSWPMIEGHLTLEEAKELASVKGGWNPTFDRSDIPEIKQHVERYFKRFIKTMQAA